jgi:hypothetical protein
MASEQSLGGVSAQLSLRGRFSIAKWLAQVKELHPTAVGQFPNPA